jgi:hypothetical protein
MVPKGIDVNKNEVSEIWYSLQWREIEEDPMIEFHSQEICWSFSLQSIANCIYASRAAAFKGLTPVFSSIIDTDSQKKKKKQEEEEGKSEKKIFLYCLYPFLIKFWCMSYRSLLFQSPNECVFRSNIHTLVLN